MARTGPVRTRILFRVAANIRIVYIAAVCASRATVLMPTNIAIGLVPNPESSAMIRRRQALGITPRGGTASLNGILLAYGLLVDRTPWELK